MMMTREDVIQFCSIFPDIIEDSPFHDANWTLMRHRGNKKTFVCIYERQGNIWLNVKCDTEWRDFWRDAFDAVIPAYHMNKEHWNSVSLEGTVPDDTLREMLAQAHETVLHALSKKLQREITGQTPEPVRQDGPKEETK